MARRISHGKVRTHNKGTPHGGHRLSSNAKAPTQRVVKRIGGRGR